MSNVVELKSGNSKPDPIAELRSAIAYMHGLPSKSADKKKQAAFVRGMAYALNIAGLLQEVEYKAIEGETWQIQHRG